MRKISKNAPNNTEEDKKTLFVVAVFYLFLITFVAVSHAIGFKTDLKKCL